MKAIFLDRDGVINKKSESGYITCWKDFVFLPGAIEGIKKMYDDGYLLFIVTNQQCIGKGLITEEDLQHIHLKMLEKLSSYKIYVKKIYFCPHLESDNCSCRKPKTGMVEKAFDEFPEIDIKKSFIIGDDLKDIEMGEKSGLNTILINKNRRIISSYQRYTSLYKPDFITENLLDTALFFVLFLLQ